MIKRGQFRLAKSAASIIQDLPAYYAARLDLKVSILPVLRLRPETSDSAKKQVIAENAIESIESEEHKLAEDVDAVFLAVTSQDLTIRASGWPFATNYRSGRFAVISTARMHAMPWFAGSNPEVFPVRVRKMMTKNLALLRYPVDLSGDPTSALATSIFQASELDQMGEDFIGESGRWIPTATSAPCFSILQGPRQQQDWRLGCGDQLNDSRFETFENYTDLPLFVMTRIDFAYDKEPALSFVRVYRPQDDHSRSFGMGGSDSFDIFPVGDSQTFSAVDLILEHGGRISFDRISLGTDVANAKLLAKTYISSRFSRSRLEWNGDGWSLTTLAGWIYKFPSSGPGRSALESALSRIDTPSGALSIERNSSGGLKHVIEPDGSWIDFICDAANRVIRAKSSSGHAIQYEYDSGGKLSHTHDSIEGDEYYKYDPANQLIEVLDGTGQTLLTNTYGYMGELTSQKLRDGRLLRYQYGFDARRRPNMVAFTDDHGFTISWIRGRGGFYATLPSPLKTHAVN